MNSTFKIKKLGEVCNVIAGQSPEGKFYNRLGKGLPFYQGKKEFTEKFIGAPTTWTAEVTKEAKKDDILMSVRAPVGPINFATENICIGRGLAAIRVTEKIDQDYLWYFLTKFENEIVRNTGAVFDSINKNQIENIDIPIPSISEQKRIVNILDEVFEKIEKAKENTEKNLQNSRDLFESYSQSIFSDKENKWDKKKLDEICIVQRGSSPRPIKKYITDNANGVNWIKIGDTKNVDRYLYSTNQKITKEGAEKSRLVKEGDLILSNSMSFGKPYIMKTMGYIHDGWFVLRPNPDLDTEYFYDVISSPQVQKQFISLASGAIVKNISGDLTKKAILPIPPLSEQKAIVKKLDRISEQTKKLEEIYKQKLVDLEELKKSVLQKAFAGEL